MAAKKSKSKEPEKKIFTDSNFLVKRIYQPSAKKKPVDASEILQWYIEDFTMNGSSEIDFINTYRDEKVPSSYKLTYFKYDWSLHKK